MLRRAKAAVSRRLQFSLFAQGYILIANQVAAAGLGMIYWAVAGRLYSSAEVGRAASALSLIMLISLVAEFGAKGMFVRYVPALGRERRAFVLVCYLLIASAAGLIAYAVQLFNLDRAFGNISDSTGCSWFVGASIAISIFYVQDGVLIAMRRSWLVLAQNVSFNVSKLLIIILLGYYAVQNAILISWFTPIPAFIILTSIVIFRRRPPVVADGQRKSRESYAEIARQTAWYYLSGLINETAGRVLPLIIIQQVGSSAAAYFFQAWLIASTLRFLSTSLASSFTVLVAETPSALAASARKALLFMTGVTALAVGGVVLLAPYILLIIGREYAEHATGILRQLAHAVELEIALLVALIDGDDDLFDVLEGVVQPGDVVDMLCQPHGHQELTPGRIHDHEPLGW